jgi:glycerol-3-phosphate acyltransferase PlsX
MANVEFLLFGDSQRLEPLVRRHKGLAGAVEIRHTDQVVKGDDKPSVALRGARESSMRKAIDAVKAEEAVAAVSAGNTGALMAMSKFVLKTIEGIDRPAIVRSVFARTVLGVERPTIGLINIGIEEIKGHEEVREAAAMLRETPLPIVFKGFIEGNDIAAGRVDVAVTDGFTGNVGVKIAEGTAKLMASFLRDAFRSTWRARLGYLLARPALAVMRERADPRQYDGAILGGLNGIVVKSHGGTDALGFSNAIGVAAEMAINGFVPKIRNDFERLKDSAMPVSDQETVA